MRKSIGCKDDTHIRAEEERRDMEADVYSKLYEDGGKKKI